MFLNLWYITLSLERDSGEFRFQHFNHPSKTCIDAAKLVLQVSLKDGSTKEVCRFFFSSF